MNEEILTAGPWKKLLSTGDSVTVSIPNGRVTVTLDRVAPNDPNGALVQLTVQASLKVGLS